MASVFVSDFGRDDGIHTYRVNGEKSDLLAMLEEITEEGAEFQTPPKISHVHRGGYTVLLKLKLQAVEVGASENKKNRPSNDKSSWK